MTAQVCRKCYNTGILSDIHVEDRDDLMALAAFRDLVGDPLPTCHHTLPSTEHPYDPDIESLSSHQAPAQPGGPCHYAR